MPSCQTLNWISDRGEVFFFGMRDVNLATFPENACPNFALQSRHLVR